MKILYDIRRNNLSPKSRQAWIDYLKGQKQAKVLAEANNQQAEIFLNKILPIAK